MTVTSISSSQESSLEVISKTEDCMTVATSSVVAEATIATTESRAVIAIDIEGAFLNADMALTRIDVNTRLNSIMTSMLEQLNSSFEKHLELDDTTVVSLDRAL